MKIWILNDRRLLDHACLVRYLLIYISVFIRFFDLLLIIFFNVDYISEIWQEVVHFKFLFIVACVVDVIYLEVQIIKCAGFVRL